jgi:hypothetical protein
MTQIRISAVTGAVPISVYISDIYGNNEFLIGTITNTGVIPPDEYFYPPALFNSAPQIMLTMIDANGCEKFEILTCTFGCGFTISVQLADCTVTMTVTPESCVFTTSVEEVDCLAVPTLQLLP